MADQKGDRRGGYRPGDFGPFDGADGGMFVEAPKDLDLNRARTVRKGLGLSVARAERDYSPTDFSTREVRGTTIEQLFASTNFKETMGITGPERDL